MKICKQICNFNKDVNIFKLALKINFGCETKVMTMKIHQGYSTGDLWGWNEQRRKCLLETGMRNKQKGKNEIKPWQGETSGGKKNLILRELQNIIKSTNIFKSRVPKWKDILERGVYLKTQPSNVPNSKEEMHA